jgi:quinol monooxygenase YgiN
MIAIIMHVRTKPDKTERFVELITQLQKDVRANEPDTILFQIMRSKDDEHMFCFTEFFTDKAAWEAHANMPYHVAMSDEGWSCLDGEPDIRTFDLIDTPVLAGAMA